MRRCSVRLKTAGASFLRSVVYNTPSMSVVVRNGTIASIKDTKAGSLGLWAYSFAVDVHGRDTSRAYKFLESRGC